MSTDIGVILSFCSPVFWQFRKVIPLWIFFFFSCTGILFARSEADLAFEIDVYAVKASGIANWFEEKYPDLRNWAKEEEQSLLVEAGIDQSIGLFDNNLTNFSIYIRRHNESMGPVSKEGGVRFNDQIFCFFYFEKQLHLPSISKWLSQSIALNLRPEKTEEILFVSSLTENNFEITLPSFIALLPPISQGIYSGLDSNISIKVINEPKGAQVLLKLSSFESFDSVWGNKQLDENNSPLPILLKEHHINFYADVSELSSHKLLRGYKPPATIQANFSGLKEVGWGASFLEASIVIEPVLVFKNQERAGKAFAYCQNSSDVLKLALSQEGKRQATLFLINKLHARHEGNQIKATLEIKSTDLEVLIPWLLSTFTSRAPSPIEKRSF
jgi:hypothetical protein